MNNKSSTFFVALRYDDAYKESSLQYLTENYTQGGLSKKLNSDDSNDLLQSSLSVGRSAPIWLKSSGVSRDGLTHQHVELS